MPKYMLSWWEGSIKNCLVIDWLAKTHHLRLKNFFWRAASKTFYSLIIEINQNFNPSNTWMFSLIARMLKGFTVKFTTENVLQWDLNWLESNWSIENLECLVVSWFKANHINRWRRPSMNRSDYWKRSRIRCTRPFQIQPIAVLLDERRLSLLV